jgi:branched-chain amino acid transport system substrate-binding protein
MAAAAADVEPFHDFRAAPLDYVGPDELVVGAWTRLTIGWFGPSDPQHPLHGDLWTAARLAVDEANEAGGWRGVPFELVPRWSENVWGTGVSLVARMVYEDAVLAILGSIDGSSTHLAEQIVAKARLPLVNPVATDDSIHLAGVPWMFSVAPADSQWAPAVATTLLETVGAAGFTLVTATDHDSRLATRALLDELARLGRGPTLRLDLRPGEDSLAGRIARLDLLNQSALLLVAGAEDGARILGAVRAAGFAGPVFAGPRLARRHALQLAGSNAEGLRVPLLGPTRSSTNTAAFTRRFRQATGSDPDWAAEHAYDAARVLLDAIRAAGPSRAGIRQALAETASRDGVSGRIDWDPTGQNRRPVTTVATVRDGRLTVD